MQRPGALADVVGEKASWWKRRSRFGGLSHGAQKLLRAVWQAEIAASGVSPLSGSGR